MPTRARWVVTALTLLVVGYPLLPGQVSRDVVQLLVELGCLTVAWHHVLKRRAVLALGWGLLVASATVTATSDLLAVLARQVQQVPAGTPANLVALLGFALLALAALRLDRHRSPGRGQAGQRVPGRRQAGGIEAAIFATGVLTPLLVFLVIPVLQRPDLSIGARSATIAYALADLVVLAVIARLVLTDNSSSRSLTYLSAALFTSFAGNIWSTTHHGGATSAQPAVVVLWLMGYVLFAAGIAHPSMESLTAVGAGVEAAPRGRRVWLLALGQAMPALALLGLCLSGRPTSGRTSSLLVVAVGGLVVSVMVSVRMSRLLGQIGGQSSQLAALARSDELTGLPNRRSWNFELTRACEAATAHARPLSIVLLDLDHFKAYNDSFGHPAGDRLLQAAAVAWRATLRDGEVLARYGGEEFAVLLPGTELADAVPRIEAMRLATPAGQSFSAGVAVWSEGRDPEQVVADADAALYDAKRRGRGRVLPFTPAPASSTSAAPYALRTVIQPLVQLADLSVVAYEALSRFDPSTDIAAVFDQAHREGYGDVLESSAVLSALRLPDRPEGVDVFVNVSDRAMRSAYFWQCLPERLDRVVVELQESDDELDDATMVGLLDRLRERGARICLEDLHGSEADLHRMVTLRPDLVKVARRLVAGCDRRPAQVARIARLLSFARAHRITVCAEGVETAEELVTLHELGVELVQGFLLGRPQSQWVEPLLPSSRVGQQRGQRPWPPVNAGSVR